MEGTENPRTRTSRFPDPAPTPPPPIDKPRTAASDHPLRLLSPLTPFSPFSDQRSVLLFDWWLIKVENGSVAEGLAVSGLTTRGQFATRIFTSAPIVKRYDAYTLETADGITVRIQGVINRARMHHSGFPPEVCRRFLTGFPYNWNAHADGFFVKKPTAERIPRSIFGVQGLEHDPNSNPDSAFPIDIKEFPLNRVLDVLNFCDSPADDVMASNMTNCLKYFNVHHNSIDTATQKSPDVRNCSSVMKTRLENVILSKIEIELRDHQQAESEVNIADNVVKHSVAAHVEEVGHQINTLVSDSLLEEGFGFKNIKSSHKSFEKPSMDDRLPESGSSLQREILLGETKEMEPDNHQSPSILGKWNISQGENVTNGNWDDRSAANKAGVAMEIGLASEALDVSHLKDGKELKNILLEKEHGTKTRVCSRNNSQPRKVFDRKDADFVDAKHSVAIETSLDADVSNSLEKPNVSRKKQKCISKGSQKRLSEEEEKTSSILRSDYAYINHTDKEPRKSDSVKPPNITSGISNHTSLEEINDACLGVLEKINNCFVNPVVNSAAEVGSVTDAERVKTSEAGFCLRTSRREPNVQGNIQNDHKCARGDTKFDTHSPMKLPKSVRNELVHSEENSRHNPLSLTEEQSSTENASGVINFGAKSGTCESQLTTPRGQTNRCVDRRTKLVERIETNSETRILRRKKKLNVEQKDNEMEKSVSEEVGTKNVVRSVTVDRNVASVVKDMEVKCRKRHVEEVSQKKVRKSTGRMRKKEQDIQHDCGGPCSGPFTPREVQLGAGDINDHIRMDNGDKGKSFQFSAGGDIEPASQSGNANDGHTTVNNTVSRTKKRRRKRNYQTVRTYATRDVANRLAFASPENLNLRRSRSGRLLVPALANWCQHLIYDVDGTITGIAGVDAQNSLFSGSKLERNKKRKQSR